MGLFKDRGNVVLPTGQQTPQTDPNSIAGLHAGLTEGSYDPNDPAFAPIEGVDLESYAKAVTAISKSGATTPEDAAKVAEGLGVPAGKWQTVSDGWVARMRQSRAVMNRYGVIYGQG